MLGNYLKASIVNAGLDPENLPTSDPSKMNFGSASTKAWRDIWGCGQGIGCIHEVPTTAALVDRAGGRGIAVRVDESKTAAGQHVLDGRRRAAIGDELEAHAGLGAEAEGPDMGGAAGADRGEGRGLRPRFQPGDQFAEVVALEAIDLQVPGMSMAPCSRARSMAPSRSNSTRTRSRLCRA